MGDQLANNPEALRLFFTEDIYLVPQVAEGSSAGTSTALNSTPLSKITSQAGAPVSVGVSPAPKAVVNMKEEIAENLTSVQEPESAYSSLIKGEAGESTGREDLPASTAAPELNFVFRGKNGRNILILVYDEVNEVTTEAGREVFKNIVKAKDLSANDYAILNYAAYKDSKFDQFKQFFNAKAILAFGVNSAQLGITDYPMHTVITHDDVRLIFSADLHQVSIDMNIKRALWTALKEMEL